MLLDDYKWSAHEGLMGKKIKSNDAFNDGAISLAQRQTSDLTTASLHADCFKAPDCVDTTIIRCEPGYSKVGWDSDNCKGVSLLPVSLESRQHILEAR